MKETAKEKAIREAYQKEFVKIPEDLDSDGWCNVTNFMQGQVYDVQLENGYLTHNCKARLVSLSGVDNNNGWIRIESESDLPNKTIDVWFLYNGVLFKGAFSGTQKQFYCDSHFFINSVTHYQPIKQPKLPIY